jgi:hypothetical protein
MTYTTYPWLWERDLVNRELEMVSIKGLRIWPCCRFLDVDADDL